MENCFICGRPGAGTLVYAADGTYLKSLCKECSKIPAQCGLCEKGQSCPFQEDTSGIPKVVVETIQKGNMTMQRQVKNPSLVEITCKQQCSCFSEEYGCLKENSICGNYVERC